VAATHKPALQKHGVPDGSAKANFILGNRKTLLLSPILAV
jgi:hypothetical protein